MLRERKLKEQRFTEPSSMESEALRRMQSKKQGCEGAQNAGKLRALKNGQGLKESYVAWKHVQDWPQVLQEFIKNTYSSIFFNATLALRKYTSGNLDIRTVNISI